MNGQLMWDMAKQRSDERVRQASRRAAARAARAAARAQRAADAEPVAVSAPVIPDFAHEMFQPAGDAVPPPRPESADGRHARTAG
jgi:predicted phosphoribosyltransferase